MDNYLIIIILAVIFVIFIFLLRKVLKNKASLNEVDMDLKNKIDVVLTTLYFGSVLGKPHEIETLLPYLDCQNFSIKMGGKAGYTNLSDGRNVRYSTIYSYDLTNVKNITFTFCDLGNRTLISADFSKISLEIKNTP